MSIESVGMNSLQLANTQAMSAAYRAGPQTEALDTNAASVASTQLSQSAGADQVSLSQAARNGQPLEADPMEAQQADFTRMGSRMVGSWGAVQFNELLNNALDGMDDASAQRLA